MIAIFNLEKLKDLIWIQMELDGFLESSESYVRDGIRYYFGEYLDKVVPPEILKDAVLNLPPVETIVLSKFADLIKDQLLRPIPTPPESIAITLARLTIEGKRPRKRPATKEELNRAHETFAKLWRHFLLRYRANFLQSIARAICKYKAPATIDKKEKDSARIRKTKVGQGALNIIDDCISQGKSAMECLRDPRFKNIKKDSWLAEIREHYNDNDLTFSDIANEKLDEHAKMFGCFKGVYYRRRKKLPPTDKIE